MARTTKPVRPELCSELLHLQARLGLSDAERRQLQTACVAIEHLGATCRWGYRTADLRVSIELQDRGGAFWSEDRDRLADMVAWLRGFRCGVAATLVERLRKPAEAGPAVHVFTGQPPTLDEAQRLVGGPVELVLDDGTVQVLVNEEGRLRGLAPNRDPSLQHLIAVRNLSGLLGPAIVLRGSARWK